MTVKLLTEQNLEFLSLTEGCTGSFESTLDKIPHCWKSHITANLVSSYLIDALFELGSLHMIVWGRECCCCFYFNCIFVAMWLLVFCVSSQGSHRLEKYLNLEGFLETSLKKN